MTPTEADIGMMAFGFGKLANLLDETQRLAEIVELELALNPMRVIARKLSACCGVSGGIPPLHGVHVFAASVSAMCRSPVV